jgi:hypothetical protein
MLESLLCVEELSYRQFFSQIAYRDFHCCYKGSLVVHYKYRWGREERGRAVRCPVAIGGNKIVISLTVTFHH